MFSTLRQNTPFYILHKGEDFNLEIGQVIDVTKPIPKYNISNFSSINTETTVDIVVKVGEEEYRFEKVPSNMSIVNTSNNVVISEDKASIINEIEDSIRISTNAIESVPYHEKVIKEGDLMLRKLNPQIAKEKKQEEDISNLKNEMGEIKNTLSSMMNILNNLNKENA
jgi:hypothetical protein